MPPDASRSPSRAAPAKSAFGARTRSNAVGRTRVFRSMKLRIAMLAPPWIPIPPPEYGGVEQVVDLVCAELERRGHDVTLFAAPGSRSPADVENVLDEPHPDEMQLAIYE